MTESYQAQILNKVIQLSEGQATIAEKISIIETSVTGLSTKLDEHIDNNNRPKDDKGNYNSRRTDRFKKWIPLIALLLSALSVFGGWQCSSWIESKIHSAFQDYNQHIEESK